MCHVYAILGRGVSPETVQGWVSSSDAYWYSVYTRYEAASSSMAVRGSAVELEPISDGRSTGPKMQIMQRPTSQAMVGLHESRISGVVAS